MELTRGKGAQTVVKKQPSCTEQVVEVADRQDICCPPRGHIMEYILVYTWLLRQVAKSTLLLWDAIDISRKVKRCNLHRQVALIGYSGG